jgi:hypothetical protein
VASFTCPDTAQFTVLSNGRLECVSSNSSTNSEWLVFDESSVALYDLLFTPQLTQDDSLLLASLIALLFATCWSYKIMGRQIGTK